MKISDLYGIIEINLNNINSLQYNPKTEQLIIRKKNGIDLIFNNIEQKQFDTLKSKVGDLYFFKIKKDK